MTNVDTEGFQRIQRELETATDSLIRRNEVRVWFQLHFYFFFPVFYTHGL